MEENLLKLKIGTKEPKKLSAKEVLIKEVRVETTEKGKNFLNCLCVHPDRDELLELSKAKLESKKGKLEVSGFWFNLDEDGQLSKHSTLARFILFATGKQDATPEDLINKSSATTEDENGYLVFKAY